MFRAPIEPVAAVWTRRVLLAGTFFGMLASYRLWLTNRRYPLVSIVEGFPVLEPPWDAVFFGLLLALLAAAWWFPRRAVALFLAGAFVLVLADQTRLPPWFYLYAVMLLLTLFPDRVALAANRIVVSAVYVWSGLQKLNSSFFEEVVPWFAKPAGRWFPEAAAEAFEYAIAAAPLIELFIGTAVWLGALRRYALATAALMHAGVLFLLGPLGHDYNLVVWPWNLTMPLLLYVLFSDRPKGRTWRNLRQSKPAFAAVLLIVGLPVLSFFGLWDSSMSFRLYSGNTARCDLLVSASLARRLPEWLRKYVVTSPGGRREIDILSWALGEVGVPPLAEPRSFRALGRYVARFARTSGEIRLVIDPRPGEMTSEDGAALNPAIRR